MWASQAALAFFWLSGWGEEEIEPGIGPGGGGGIRTPLPVERLKEDEDALILILGESV